MIEEVVDPARPIVDPHHHLWPAGGALPYGLDELHSDVDGTSSGGGHRIVRTGFVECGAAYDHAAPEHLMSVGETSFVAGESARDPAHLIGGIVSSADLRRPDLDEILDAHAEAGGHLFKGIRHALSSAEHPEALRIPGRACLLYTSDAAEERSSGDLGGRRIIKKKTPPPPPRARETEHVSTHTRNT